MGDVGCWCSLSAPVSTISSFGYKYSEDEFRISNVFALNIMKKYSPDFECADKSLESVKRAWPYKWSIIGLNDANAYMERAL